MNITSKFNTGFSYSSTVTAGDIEDLKSNTSPASNSEKSGANDTKDIFSLNSFKTKPLKESAVLILIFLVYFISGKLGLTLAFENASATAVWAPTGIALAAFLLRGYHVWPAILAGAFLINITTTGNIPTSAFIAIGNTGEGLLGAYLVNKYAGGINVFDRTVNVFRFVFLAGVLSTALSATIGVTSLALWGLVGWSSYLSVWLTWWIGDAVGAFLLTPFLIFWFRKKPVSPVNNHPVETAAVFVVLAVISIIGFTPITNAATENSPLGFILIPPFVWIAFRFNKRFVSTAAFFVCAAAIWGTISGYGPFVVASMNDSLLFLQAFISIITVMTLAFASVVEEYRETEKRAGEAERRRWEAFYKLLEKLPAGAYTCDKNGLITYFNEQAVNVWGRTPKLNDLEYRYCGSVKLFIGDKPIAHNECWMSLALQQEKGFNGEELIIQRPDGTRIEVLTHANPIHDKSGELVGAVNVLVDISEQKKILRALEEAYNKMEEKVIERTEELRKAQAELIHSEKLASLGRFSAGIAHEIRNPLANISSLSQLLLRKNTDSDIEKHLQYINANSNIANKIIKDLLNVASPHNVNFETVNTAKLINNVCNCTQARCEKSNITLIRDIAPDLPNAHLNENKIEAAFLNLISNAIEAMPHGGELKISAGYNKLIKKLIVSFEDTGTGITEENMDKVLEPFFTTKHDGTGLGLSLVYHVIKAHSGKTEFESKLNKGTKFTITLPMYNETIN